MAIHVLIGAAVGAVLGAGTSVVTSLVRKKPIDWRSVGAAALGGAAAGAITTLTFGAGALAGTAVARVGGMTLAGAAGGFTERSSDNVFHGEKWSAGVVKSTAEGAALGAAAGVVRVGARPVASMLARNPELKREVARRVAGLTTRTLRLAWERYRAQLVRNPRRTLAATAAALSAVGRMFRGDAADAEADEGATEGADDRGQEDADRLPGWLERLLDGSEVISPELRPVLEKLAGPLWRVVARRGASSHTSASGDASQPVIDRALGEDEDALASGVEAEGDPLDGLVTAALDAGQRTLTVETEGLIDALAGTGR